jgi:F0F1-type ATP synthase gamma subunit
MKKIVQIQSKLLLELKKNKQQQQHAQLNLKKIFFKKQATHIISTLLRKYNNNDVYLHL